jgi:uncharacterized protein YjiS (DUF1127 family)
MYILGYIYYLNQTLTGGLAYPPADHIRAGNTNRSEEGPGITARIGTALRRAWVTARRRQVRGSVERTLRRLPDWTLRDIGIPRAEIPEAAAALASGDIDDHGRPNRQPAPDRTVAPAHATPRRKAALVPVGCG